MADTDLLRDRGRRRGQRGVLTEVISDQTHSAGPDLGIDLLRHVAHPSNSKECGIKLGALHASVAGVAPAPAPRDSGRISGNHHRPRRLHRRLLRTCYLAALSSLKNSPASRAFYDRKRHEGKNHKQALLALARRRINVLWAMLRDHTIYQEPTVTPTLKTA
jgi:hypothetical protein